MLWIFGYSPNVSWVNEVYDALRRRARAAYWSRSAFNGDGIEQALVKLLIPTLGVDRIVETGTFLGHTTYFLARAFPAIPIDTVEIDDAFVARARRNLRGCGNVTIHHENSARFVVEHAPSYALVNPLFYLDAHWNADLPLDRELAAIMHLPRAVVLIDDFKVPGRPDYAFALEGGMASSFEGRFRGADVMALEGALDGESVAAHLDHDPDLVQLFPDYRHEDMLLENPRAKFGNLVGYTLVLHGQDASSVDLLLGDPWVARRFRKRHAARENSRLRD